MAKTWIQSLSNAKLEPLDLTPAMVGGIEEVAHALAGEFRFTRQTRKYYSVAEHSVRGSQLLPPCFAGAFLLHELSEVYLSDVSAPLKPRVYVDVMGNGFSPDGHLLAPVPWAELEKRHTHTMLAALGLSSLEPLIYSPEIKAMDLAMLVAEKRDLCGPEPESWGLEHIAPAEVQIFEPWSPAVAEAEFLKRFAELFKV